MTIANFGVAIGILIVCALIVFVSGAVWMRVTDDSPCDAHEHHHKDRIG